MTSYFAITGAAKGVPEHLNLRPMSDLPALERDLDEIEARAQAPNLDFKTIWSNYNRNKGTPTTASMRPSQKITEDEVRKRLTR